MTSTWEKSLPTQLLSASLATRVAAGPCLAAFAPAQADPAAGLRALARSASAGGPRVCRPERMALGREVTTDEERSRLIAAIHEAGSGRRERLP
jgi:hypothetical protein